MSLSAEKRQKKVLYRDVLTWEAVLCLTINGPQGLPDNTINLPNPKDYGFFIHICTSAITLS